jgi:hypothetical protein
MKKEENVKIAIDRLKKSKIFIAFCSNKTDLETSNFEDDYKDDDINTTVYGVDNDLALVIGMMIDQDEDLYNIIHDALMWADSFKQTRISDN